MHAVCSEIREALRSHSKNEVLGRTIAYEHALSDRLKVKRQSHTVLLFVTEACATVHGSSAKEKYQLLITDV